MEIPLSSDSGTDIGTDVTSGWRNFLAQAFRRMSKPRKALVCGYGGSSYVSQRRYEVTYPFHGEIPGGRKVWFPPGTHS